MSVQESEERVQALTPEELTRFSEWFDAYMRTVPLAEDDESEVDLSEEQKQEILRRRAAYLADPSIAVPWEGTTERILQHLNERRRRKAATG